MTEPKPPTRTVPVTAPPISRSSWRARPSSDSMASAASASTRPAGVSETPVGWRSSTVIRVSASSRAICWETADGLTIRSSAAATTELCLATAKRTPSLRGSIFMKKNLTEHAGS